MMVPMMMMMLMMAVMMMLMMTMMMMLMMMTCSWSFLQAGPTTRGRHHHPRSARRALHLAFFFDAFLFYSSFTALLSLFYFTFLCQFSLPLFYSTFLCHFSILLFFDIFLFFFICDFRFYTTHLFWLLRFSD